MALSCVNGCHECTGCMACQFDDDRRIPDMTKAQKRKLKIILEKLEELYTDLEELRDAEQDKIDNMAESFAETQRYAEMEEAVSKMEDALDAIEDAKDSIEEACA